MSHELQHSFVGDTVKSTQGSIRETMRPKAVQIRMNNLAVNGITDLVNLVDKRRPVEVDRRGRQTAVGWV